MENKAKKVLLITTGGTIASKKDRESGQVQSGVISGYNLAALIPSWKDFSCKVVDLFQLPSGHLTMLHLREIAQTIKAAFQEGCCHGVVLTHGTDTLEETAYFLDLVLHGCGPVVLTGSQLPPEEIASDALRNLEDSFKVVLSEESQDKGVLVVFNGKIYAASEVIKVHTSNLDAFAAPGWGPIGYLDEKEVIFKRVVNKRVKLALGKNQRKPKVYIISFALGMDGYLIDKALEAGAEGLVLEGFGRGQIPPEAVEQVETAVNKGIPVVLTTRCYEGSVKGVYDYRGSAAQLEKIGVIMGEDLPKQKARIKLILALANNMSFKEINELF
ncbi:asparaginase [Desulfitibacter alkalitolerans]|uniref:asparaginase n=1 Tax=Desulfitibacter alkalitolerans TaxID=264641 RepID=UPI0004872927|nr:asparaginase [Desulfitibacter alkalitolerans]